MKTFLKTRLTFVTLVLCAGTAWADPSEMRAQLSGYQEVPAVSSKATGDFRMRIDRQDATITWELRYEGIESAVQQAHIHFGQHSVNGGISVFLCSNLGNGPAGTQPCPLRSGTISGTITAASVLGPDVQGIAPGEIDALVAALREQLTYVNVHSTRWTGGEIRGQIGNGRGGHHH
jgi:hypothetical protein